MTALQPLSVRPMCGTHTHIPTHTLSIALCTCTDSRERPNILPDALLADLMHTLTNPNQFVHIVFDKNYASKNCICITINLYKTKWF